MTRFDVFNGDADGICALQQLRLDAPAESVLVTGTKRDIDLVRRVDARAGDHVTVLDVSHEVNASAVAALLARGVTIEYFDHHRAGAVPTDRRLRAHIDTAPDRCTALIVDAHLAGRQRLWAIVGAFGDGLGALAAQLAATLGIGDPAPLRTLGESINYNAYGTAVTDLHIAPAALYRRIAPFADPRAFIAADPLARTLAEAMASDLEAGRAVPPLTQTDRVAIILLPPLAWARRVHGALANRLARESPDRAHAVLAPIAPDAYTVSVRAPLVRPHGAGDLCSEFATGGGRAAAGGINHLPATDLARFEARFSDLFSA